MASPLRLNTIRNEEQFYHPPLPPATPQMTSMPQGGGSAMSTGIQYPDGFPPDTSNLPPAYLPGDQELISLIDRNLAQPDVASQPPSSGLQLASSMGGGGESSDFNWITAIGAGLQSAGAAHFGNYNVPQQYFQMKQQADMRKEMFAQQQAQAEEAKRQHNMLMTEKLIQTGNLDALNAFGKEFAPAGLIGSAMAQKDLAEVPSLVKGGYLDQTFVESIFDKDPSKRPTPGQIKAHVDFAKEMFKEDYKANVKNAALDKALALPPEKRSPGQQRLVDDHQTEIELKKAQTEEHSAKAIKALEGDDAKLSYGIDRVSIAKERFGLAPKDLTPEQMGRVNQEYKELQGFLSGQRAKESQQAQLSIPDKLPLAHVEKIMDDIQAVQHVENLKSMFDADKMGRIRGTLGGVAEWAGLLGTDESTLRAEVATMKNAIIKARSGLAVTEAEGKRIDKETPNMTDSPTIFAAKLKLTERNLRALANKRRQLYKQAGYDISHIAPLEGQEGVAAGTIPSPKGGEAGMKYGSLEEWKKAHGY
jgi:hypothetical protein